jgi:hypothetical protein
MTRLGKPIESTDIATENLVVAEHDSGDDSGLRVRVHIELLGCDRVVV